MWPVEYAIVLDAREDEAALWHLYTGPGRMPAAARFLAAWTLRPNEVPRLDVWKDGAAALATVRSEPFLPRDFFAPERRLHGTELVRLLTERIRTIDVIVDGAQSSGRFTSAVDRPMWPSIPMLGLPTETPDDGEKPRHTASHNATWLTRFCIAWQAVDQRVMDHHVFASDQFERSA